MPSHPFSSYRLRGLMFNPRWPWRAAMELGAKVFYPPQYERAHPDMRGGDFLKPAPDADDPVLERDTGHD